MNISKLTTTSKASIGFVIIGAVLAVAMVSRVQAADTSGIRQEGGEYWKNSSQTFPLNPDGQFNIDNVNGQIEVHGWSSNAVVLVSKIHGKTRENLEAVKVRIDADANHIDIHTEQESKGDKQNDAIVDYIVQVPEHALLKGVSSVNGRITIDGVAGDITASTVNGQTQIKDARHNLKLNTVNGSISAEMNSLGSGQSVSFSTVNGAVKLAVPENADAKFAMNTLNGGIHSDFTNLKATKEFPVGNNLKASLGSGSARVDGSTVNGSIEIVKR